jgi:hypothetical protein
MGLCFHFNLPLAFVDAVLKPSVWSKQSGAFFQQRDDEGQLQSIGILTGQFQ